MCLPAIGWCPILHRRRVGKSVHLTYISATIAIGIAILCAWYCRRLALEKGRRVLPWIVLGLILTVVAVPVLVLLPAAGGETSAPPPDLQP